MSWTWLYFLDTALRRRNVKSSRANEAVQAQHWVNEKWPSKTLTVVARGTERARTRHWLLVLRRPPVNQHTQFEAKRGNTVSKRSIRLNGIDALCCGQTRLFARSTCDFFLISILAFWLLVRCDLFHFHFISISGSIRIVKKRLGRRGHAINIHKWRCDHSLYMAVSRIRLTEFDLYCRIGMIHDSPIHVNHVVSTEVAWMHSGLCMGRAVRGKERERERASTNSL